MSRRLCFSICAVLVVGQVNTAGAGLLIMQCDVGGGGPLQSGWANLGYCGVFSNVAGSGIDVHLATGNPNRCTCSTPGGSGTLADVEWDLLYATDVSSSPEADFIITFSNLIPGARYRLLSYHSRTDEGDTTIPGVTITGATVVSVPASIVQNHAIMDNPAECVFVPGTGDVSIRYLAPVGGCDGCQAFLNGFVLELDAPFLTFESDVSGGVETISPALVPVNLINSEPNETYTVQYDVIGGTATAGDDYSFTPGTLIFSPGQTTKNISIDIVDDGEPEEDETIILELSNATGLDVVLGVDQHTYTISDTPPKVSFLAATSSGLEDTTPALVPVKLSLASDQTVTVDYAATSGSAVNGDDYILADSTLQFDPLQTTEYISIDIVGDSDLEPDETIILGLSDPCNATLGTITQHTRTIRNDEEGIVWEDKVWYYSEHWGRPFVNAEGQLEWAPKSEGQYVTRIPPQPLSEPGHKVEIVYWYMSDGKDDCPPDSCYNCIFCRDITCIAGTSDFRFGLFQADGEYVTADGMGNTNSIFQGYKGYNWRFGPHLQPYPTRWNECTGEVHKTGHFAKKPQSNSDLMRVNDGLKEYIPGFDLPPGEWSPLTISLERLSLDDVEMSITLNDTTYSWIDGSSSEQPTMIDVFAVHMRNPRPYSQLVLGSLSPGRAWDPSPMDGAEEVDPNVGLSWRSGRSASWHDVYFGTDFDDVNDANTSSSEYKGRQSVDANSYDPPGPLEPEPTYYWRVDELNEPNVWTGDVWSFRVYEARAGSPTPVDGSKDVPRDVELGWSPGFVAASHDVYFGTDFDDVNDADTTDPCVFMGNQDSNSWDPGGLDFGATYYWRIDEVNGPDTWKGDVWSFTAANYIIVEDMESYETTYDLHSTWVDTWRQPLQTGAVLDLGDYACCPVHGGDKAMEYEYWTDRFEAGWPDLNYAEAYLPLIGDKRDWTQASVKALTLYFFGDPNNDANDTEQMYVGLSDGNDTYAEVRYGDYGEGEDMNDIKLAEWQEWNIELSDFNGVNLADVNNLHIGFGDRDNPVPGGKGTVYFDDIRLYPPR